MPSVREVSGEVGYEIIGNDPINGGPITKELAIVIKDSLIDKYRPSYKHVPKASLKEHKNTYVIVLRGELEAKIKSAEDIFPDRLEISVHSTDTKQDYSIPLRRVLFDFTELRINKRVKWPDSRRKIITSGKHRS